MKKELVVEYVGRKRISKETLILFGLFLIIGVVFYVSLGMVKSGENVALSEDEERNFSFGIREILTSVVFAFLITGFLLWVKSIMIKNAYLGGVIGIVGGFVMGYGFSRGYWGPYSIGFMIVTGLVVVANLGMNFVKFRSQDKSVPGEFDDS
jgi:hypothetical protein